MLSSGGGAGREIDKTNPNWGPGSDGKFDETNPLGGRRVGRGNLTERSQLAPADPVRLFDETNPIGSRRVGREIDGTNPIGGRRVGREFDGTNPMHRALTGVVLAA